MIWLARTYRRIRSEVEAGPRVKHSFRGQADNSDWQAQHEARLLAEQTRVQAELVHHPEAAPHQHAHDQRMTDRRTLLVLLVGQGGRALRKWLRAELGWNSLRLEAAIKFPAWFVREGTCLRLTTAGAAAAREADHG